MAAFFDEIGSMFFGDQSKNEFRNINREMYNLPGFDSFGRQAREGLAGGRGEQFRNAEIENLQNLRDVASGRGPFLSKIEADRNIRNAIGLMGGRINSARIDPTRAARLGLQETSRISGTGAGEAAEGVARERLGAMGQLAQSAIAGRAEDRALLSGMLGMELEAARAQQAGQIESERERGRRFETISGMKSEGEKLAGAIAGGLLAATGG